MCWMVHYMSYYSISQMSKQKHASVMCPGVGSPPTPMTRPGSKIKKLHWVDYTQELSYVFEDYMYLLKTSWANTRVKLHSQVHLVSKKRKLQKKFESKKFCVQKNVSSKKFCAHKILDPKIFWVQKPFWLYQTDWTNPCHNLIWSALMRMLTWVDLT